jgi:D-tyrosyl-tRNA(Tyr) deacylase
VRAVAQRVRRARVSVGDEVVGEMGAGLLALVGVGVADGEADADELARKLVQLRVFEDEQGRMNHSLVDIGGTLGVVSQFTLFGDTRKGRRPSFGAAAPPALAEPLVARVIEAARSYGVTTVSGRFGAHMEVELLNDGPVTLWLDTGSESGSESG